MAEFITVENQWGKSVHLDPSKIVYFHAYNYSFSHWFKEDEAFDGTLIVLGHAQLMVKGSPADLEKQLKGNK